MLDTLQTRIAKVNPTPWTFLRAFLLGFIVGPFFYGITAGANDYRANLFTELMGIAFTALVIDWIYRLRIRHELRNRLVREAGSRSNAIAIGAVEWLRAEGWLEGNEGLLQGEDTNLDNANLEGADLRGANLRGTRLRKANLGGADLSRANLQNAKLYRADFTGARVLGTDFKYADLRSADLRAAVMKLRDLGEEQEMGLDLFADDMDTSEYHADLRYADLEGAYLEGATLPHESRICWATLPLGEKFDHPFDIKKLKKYTDRCNPEFRDTLQRIEDRRLGMRAVATSGAYASVIPDED